MEKSATSRKNKYNSKTYDSVNFRVKKDGSDGITPQMIADAAVATGMSQNAYIIQALKEKMESSDNCYNIHFDELESDDTIEL